jgi:hypothetical protein
MKPYELPIFHNTSDGNEPFWCAYPIEKILKIIADEKVS